MPGRKDSPPGTAGSAPATRFAQAEGAFQVLMRVQYLRTQVQAWRRSAGVHGATCMNEIELGLRGLGAAACAAGLSVYAQTCQRLTAHLESMYREGGVSAHLLSQLLEWLSASARHVRRPGSPGVAEGPPVIAEAAAAPGS
jgi:hypothetical protein